MRVLPIMFVLCAVLSQTAVAEDHAIGARIGMLGIGVEYSYRLNERIAVRGGVNGSGFSFDEIEAGIDYGFDLDFDSVSLGVDIHPFKGKFRLSTGLLKNDSGLSAIATPGQSLTIGGTSYAGSDVGRLVGRIGFDSTAPFVAVGWDWLHNKKLGIALDIGVVSQGSPIVSLRADGPIANDPGFIADLAVETLELQQSLDDFDLYPYAMFGLVVRF